MRVTLENPDSDDLFRWEVESSKPTKEGYDVVLDVMGQGLVPREESIEMLEPRLEDLYAVAVFGDDSDRDVTARRRVAEEASGSRFRDFYENFFENERDIFMDMIQTQGLDEALDTASEIERNLKMAPEFIHANTAFGTGFDNYIVSDDLSGAFEQFEEALGFQILFSYTGDAEASQRYGEYTSGASIIPGDTEGVTGVVNIGRSDHPEVYMAGPPDMDVEMPAFTGYEDTEIGYLHELI